MLSVGGRPTVIYNNVIIPAIVRNRLAACRASRRFPLEVPFKPDRLLEQDFLDAALIDLGNVVLHPGLAQEAAREFDHDVIGLDTGVVLVAR